VKYKIQNFFFVPVLPTVSLFFQISADLEKDVIDGADCTYKIHILPTFCLLAAVIICQNLLTHYFCEFILSWTCRLQKSHALWIVVDYMETMIVFSEFNES
jgi:hypothetical protein